MHPHLGSPISLTGLFQVGLSLSLCLLQNAWSFSVWLVGMCFVRFAVLASRKLF